MKYFKKEEKEEEKEKQEKLIEEYDILIKAFNNLGDKVDHRIDQAVNVLYIKNKLFGDRDQGDTGFVGVAKSKINSSALRKMPVGQMLLEILTDIEDYDGAIFDFTTYLTDSIDAYRNKIFKSAVHQINKLQEENQEILEENQELKERLDIHSPIVSKKEEEYLLTPTEEQEFRKIVTSRFRKFSEIRASGEMHKVIPYLNSIYVLGRKNKHKRDIINEMRYTFMKELSIKEGQDLVTSPGLPPKEINDKKPYNKEDDTNADNQLE